MLELPAALVLMMPTGSTIGLPRRAFGEGDEDRLRALFAGAGLAVRRVPRLGWDKAKATPPVA